MIRVDRRRGPLLKADVRAGLRLFLAFALLGLAARLATFALTGA